MQKMASLAGLVSFLAFAQDSFIAEATNELNRIESAIGGVTKGDEGKYNELTGALNDLTRKMSKADRTPALSAANTRSKELRARLAAAFEGRAASAQGPALSTTERGAMQRFDSELGMAQQVLDQTPPEKFKDSHEAFVREKVKKCEVELGRGPKADHPLVVAGRAKLVTLLADLGVRVRDAKQLAPGAKAVTAAVATWLTRLEKAKTDAPLDFQDTQSRTVKGLRDELERFGPQLVMAGNAEHPDAKEAAAAIDAAKAQLEAALTEAKAMAASLGDYHAELARLASTFDNRAQLKKSATPEMIDGWVASLEAIEAELNAAQAYFEKVKRSVAGFTQTRECSEFEGKVRDELNSFQGNVTYWESQFIYAIQKADARHTDVAEGTNDDTYYASLSALQEGIAASERQAVFYGVYKKNQTAVAEAKAKKAELEGRLVKLDADMDKVIEAVRMPKEIGTAQMKALTAQVTKSADFVSQMKSEGNTLLRAVVVDDHVSKTNSWEWHSGKYVHRDFDSFAVFGAFKNKEGKVYQWQFSVRFARADWPGIKTGVWTFGGWTQFSMIREKNVFK